jgi:putative ABC transport system ATP-binding protein
MASVEVRNVIKAYKRDTDEVKVLDGLSLSIQDGEFVALMGPSGSGKTTLLNLIGGVDQPTSGDIEVAGTNISRMSGAQLAKWRSASIGYIFQLYNLIPVLTALENVELPLLLVRMRRAEPPQARERPRWTWSGSGSAQKHYPRQLSGGQEQRGIARVRLGSQGAARRRAHRRSRSQGRRGRAPICQSAQSRVQEEPSSW